MFPPCDRRLPFRVRLLWITYEFKIALTLTDALFHQIPKIIYYALRPEMIVFSLVFIALLLHRFGYVISGSKWTEFEGGEASTPNCMSVLFLTQSRCLMDFRSFLRMHSWGVLVWHDSKEEDRSMNNPTLRLIRAEASSVHYGIINHFVQHCLTNSAVFFSAC